MSTSSSELSASPSPPQSPVADQSIHEPPSLARLVVHFVDAKRSLTASTDVYRANGFVVNSRSLIEEIAVLNAKNAYAKRSLDDQAHTLGFIRDALADEGDNVADEFETTIAALDKAHARLDKTLNQLRRTVVTAKQSQSRTHSEVDASRTEQHDENKTLFDFVDEATHENLLSSLRGLIDSYHDARADLNSDLSSFGASLKAVIDKLSDNADIAVTLEPDKPTIYDDPLPSIPHLFHSLEEHATEMASLLENLVNHYDLCVNALKHTEGGGQAAKAAVQQADEMKGATAVTEESLYGRTVAEPISEDERVNMLHVLEKDAMQVEEVTIEIRDRISEMEDQYAQLTKYAQKARSQYKTLRQVLTLLHELRAAIPHQIQAATKFREEWQSINSSMRTKTTELTELSVFYEQFLSGYGKLLKEVERRKSSESTMRRIAEKARKELEKLHEIDRQQREEFWEDVAAYMPRDLGVWHGLDEDATRWEVRPVYSDIEQDHSRHRLLDG